MLQNLRIRNFALIDELNLSFSKGFNVITGETGTGKSIILNAVHLLLGDRAGEEMIRSSEEEANVEALFDISGNREAKERIKEKAPKVHCSEEEDSFLVRRVISRSGRGKVFINENLVTLGMLSEVGEKLLSVYGQHEHQSLQRAETHIDILDEFGVLLDLREEFQEHFERYISLSEEVRRIREEKERRIKEQELMAFQLREIEASGIRMGEEEALKEERRILSHAKKLMDFINLSEELLYEGEGSTVERIQTILRQGREMAAIDPSLNEVIKGLETASIQLEEIALSLRNYLRRIEINPARLEEVENRLEEVERLKRKYGLTVEGMLHFKEKIEKALRSFTSNEERLNQLEGIMGSLQGEVIALARKLSWERKRVASELKKSVEKELGSLGMKKTAFEVRMEDTPLSPKGMDRVEFLISPNVGEEVKPLAKIASGGELSRMMLAMKKILARIGGRQVLVFDEVDSGIGGAIAEVVGKKLKELSKDHQVVCVTHLPQIACFADTHHSVRKEVREGRTFTIVDQLEKEAVADEIARMLGGVKVTEKTRAHAKEMIENARKS
ncbi:MAG: DNA repair protein RecN [Thermodesulfobacteriota bacterium]|nr:DNA repair protein RecN [Thermodesulfobacteriota bacterium]